MLFCPGRVIAVSAAFAWSYVAVVAIDICLAIRGLYDGTLSLLWALYFGGVGAKKSPNTLRQRIPDQPLGIVDF